MLPPPEELPERKRLRPIDGHTYIGTRLFGRVQETSRGQFIATRFFHILFFPIIPFESYLVTESSNGRLSGFEIPKNHLSVFVAYLRGLSGCVFVSALWFNLDYLEHRNLYEFSFIFRVLIILWFLLAGLGMIGLIFSYISPKITKANAATQKWISSIIESEIA